MVDWSLLPRDLLELINSRLETCFDTAHLRSVCSLWRSAVPPPSNRRGLSIKTLLPIFSDNIRFEDTKHCVLHKIPVFLFRYETPFGADCLIVGMSESNSDTQKLVCPSPGFGFTSQYGKVLNTLSTQIIHLDHNYVINYSFTVDVYSSIRRLHRTSRVAFLPQDGRDFTVVAGVSDDLMMYRSCEERWIKIEGGFRSSRDMVSFKGKFYVVDRSGWGRVFVIEQSLEVSEIHSVKQSDKCFWEALVVSGDDELLLVQQFTPGKYHPEHMYTWFRLFRLVEEEGQRRWVRVTDLEDRVVVLGFDWNFCYSAKEIPGMKGNCVMFTPNTARKKILMFDLGTRKTIKAFTRCRGMDVFCENKECLFSCGIVKMTNPVINIYNSSGLFGDLPEPKQKVSNHGLGSKSPA